MQRLVCAFWGAVFGGISGGISGAFETVILEGFVAGAIVGSIVGLIFSDPPPEQGLVLYTVSFWPEVICGGATGAVVAEAGYIAVFFGCGLGAVAMQIIRTLRLGRDLGWQTGENLITFPTDELEYPKTRSEAFRADTVPVKNQPDTNFYQQVQAELESGKKDLGIWTKAFANTLNEEEAIKFYINLRAEDLRRRSEKEYEVASRSIEKLEMALQKARRYRLFLFLLILVGSGFTSFAPTETLSTFSAVVFVVSFYVLIYKIIRVWWLKRALKREEQNL